MCWRMQVVVGCRWFCNSEARQKLYIQPHLCHTLTSILKLQGRAREKSKLHNLSAEEQN